MKRILITGANSYIGTSFEEWVSQWPDQYMVDTIDMIDGSWRDKDFSQYDVVFHVAGIAHVDTKKATKETQDLYYKVNCDLTIETATKAKCDGVKQFIFMSSIIVYGENISLRNKRVINMDTIPSPNNFYGDSKLQAEIGILKMKTDNFHLAVLRPPMIYGKGSKGNYRKLAKLAKLTPIFPNIKNERSMLHVENLCEFLRLIIDNEESGIFFPQNDEYVCTSNMVQMIAEYHGKKIHLINISTPLIKLLFHKIKILNKVFGSVLYSKDMSKYKTNYNVHNLYETITVTEEL
jgi:UDP-glucose 4-epimerase